MSASAACILYDGAAATRQAWALRDGDAVPEVDPAPVPVEDEYAYASGCEKECSSSSTGRGKIVRLVSTSKLINRQIAEKHGRALVVVLQPDIAALIATCVLDTQIKGRMGSPSVAGARMGRRRYPNARELTITAKSKVSGFSILGWSSMSRAPAICLCGPRSREPRSRNGALCGIAPCVEFERVWGHPLHFERRRR
jgi:hypothetical protein